MSDKSPEPPVDLGIYSRPESGSTLEPADKVALVVTVI